MNSTYYWQRDEVLRRLDARMAAAFIDVQQRAAAEQVSLRDGASERVAHACRERGWV